MLTPDSDQPGPPVKMGEHSSSPADKSPAGTRSESVQLDHPLLLTVNELEIVSKNVTESTMTKWSGEKGVVINDRNPATQAVTAARSHHGTKDHSLDQISALPTCLSQRV